MGPRIDQGKSLLVLFQLYRITVLEAPELIDPGLELN